MGRTEDARKVLANLRELASRSDVVPEAAATIYANLGEKDEALTWVEKGYDARSGFLPALRNSPAFDSLRSEPRFRDVMKKMNLPVEPAGAR